MRSAPLRDDENDTLQALRALQVLDTGQDPEFDALVQSAALAFDVPIALVSLVDVDRQWFKANTGLDGVSETPREQSFCAHAVLGDELLEVPDATRDVRFHDNPLVLGEPRIRFYAGAPLQLSDGHRVGTLCLIDRQPRTLTHQERELLRALAAVASRALEGRRALLVERQAAMDSASAALVLQHSADAIVGTDAAGTIVRWNPAAERLFGHRRDEALGRSLDLILPPEQRADLPGRLARLRHTGAQTFDAFRLHRDGTPIPVGVTLVPELDAAGGLLGATAFFRDSRERERVLAELAASEDRLRTLYESTPAMLHAIDEDGRITMVSDTWLARLGYRREDVLGRHAVEFLTEDSRRMALTHCIPALLASGRQDDLAVQMLTRDGEVIDVLLTAILDPGGPDHPMRILAGLIDVTERRRVERELDRERQRLLNIIEGTHAGIWEWHVPSGELRLNERSAAILGFSLAELGPLTIALRTERTHPEDLASMTAAMRRHLSGEIDHYEVESRVRHRDGHWVWILDRGRLMTRTPDGKPEWVFGIHQDISARKAQEAALRRSEAFLDRTGRAAGVGGWEVEIATGEVTWSDETRRIHGVPPDFTPTVETGIEFYAPEARPVIRAAVETALADGSPWDLELPLLSGDGLRIWVRAIGTVEFENDRPARLTGAFQDITVRKILERRLVEKERFLRQVLDGVPGLIAHIGPDRRYTLVNRAYLEWMRRPPGELVGNTVAGVHGATTWAILAPHLERAFAGETVTFDLELNLGGEPRAMHVTYVPDFDEAGRVVGVFSMKVDVTALRRAEERLRLVMEFSPQGMFTADLDGNYTFTNAAWQRIVGLSFEESLGAGLRKVVHPDDMAGLLDCRRAVLDHGGIESSEYRILRPDGTLVWARGHITVLRRDGEPDSFIGTTEDITERRRLDEVLAARSAALARSNEDLERFAYVASHDLQEPLRMVTSYGQLLERRHAAALPEQAREYLHFMVDGGQRAQALIRDLLSLARLDSHTRPRVVVSLEKVLADTLHQLRLKVQETGAVITHDPLPDVVADATQMGQLLSNLIGNALKFHGPAVPVVHIGAERDTAAWRISVRDNGIGIDPKFFERVFVMFQRLHLRSEHEGTGIGLAICKRIVEGHGGRIGVRSTPGQGTTFHFTLPDAPEHAQ